MTPSDLPQSLLADAFSHLVGSPPVGVWSAPGRVNFLGEHTDYALGLALPFAIDARASVAARPRGDGDVVVASRQRPGPPVRVSEADLHPGRVPGWPGYLAGVVWSLRAAGHDVPGFDLLLDSDVPAGSGLSSSAAVGCAVTLACRDLAGLDLSLAELVPLAQRAEVDFVGVPCGLLDQTASLLATASHLLLLDARDGSIEQLAFEAAGLALLLVDTRAPHVLSDGAYAERRHDCDQAARLLGLASLREVTDRPAALAALPEGRLRRRARHVLTENDRVRQAVNLVRASRVGDTGPLLTASHVSLRDDHDVSTPELDLAVGSALAAGALGARLTGAGFGGSVLCLVPAEAVAAVTAAVTTAFRAAAYVEPDCQLVAPSPGARRDR